MHDGKIDANISDFAIKNIDANLTQINELKVYKNHIVYADCTFEMGNLKGVCFNKPLSSISKMDMVIMQPEKKLFHPTIIPGYDALKCPLIFALNSTLTKIVVFDYTTLHALDLIRINNKHKDDIITGFKVESR